MSVKVLNKREKNIFIAAVGVILFALLFNFIIAPVLSRQDALNKEISVTRAKLAKYLWLISQKDSIQAKYGNFGAASSGEDNLVNALAQLETIAKDCDIKITDLRPQASRSGGLYKEILIDLRTQGSMEGHLKFMYELEHSLSLLRIKKFQLASRPNSALLEGTFSIAQISE